MELLREFECIVISRDQAHPATTERGNLFAELPYDPRMSQFVMCCHEKFNHLSLGLDIAALLAAPGSIFFMGGSSMEARNEAKIRISDAAAHHDSDLLFFRSVYRSWLEAGAVDMESCCSTCHRKVASGLVLREGGCRGCRSAYAAKNGLNNKVPPPPFYSLTVLLKILDMVRQTTTSAEKIILSARRSAKARDAAFEGMQVDEEEAVGRSLAST